VPFLGSTPSAPLTAATFTCVTLGVLLPFSPLAHTLGFTALPAGFLAVLAAMIVVYLVLIELGKLRFYRIRPHGPPVARPRPEREHRIHHRASLRRHRKRARAHRRRQDEGMPHL
jgi:P-type Mg2+ transporter